MSVKSCFYASGTLLCAVFLISSLATAEVRDGRALVNDYCTACHEMTPEGDMARISQVRKTPEGWDMTLFRMEHLHGLELADEERRAIIQYLSGEYGLAPSEAAPFRFVLEQRAHFVDTAVNEDLDALCGRCHTNARYGLQRRTADDWLKHMHFHIGQFPSLEYQARSRDRFWWREVTTETYKELAALYPFRTDAWAAWKNTAPKSPAGVWRVSGHRPGVGGYQGVMTVAPDGDHYTVDYKLRDFDGTSLDGDSKAVIYTGYEWRGTGELSGMETREVYALSEDGTALSGRWYQAGHYDVGGEFSAVRLKGAAPQVMTQTTDHIRQGEKRQITFYGVGLSGDVSADKGLTLRVVAADDTTVVAEVAAAGTTPSGRYDIRIGEAETEIVVYDRIDAVKVYPEWTVARLGGGKTPPVTAQFEAIAYMKGADGVIGSDDDIRIGRMPATWEALPHDEEAAQMKDVAFAGTLTAQGTFLPAVAGPNPARKFSTNNVGNLKIVARIADGAREVAGAAQLIVTVQRWNQPPIR